MVVIMLVILMVGWDNVAAATKKTQLSWLLIMFGAVLVVRSIETVQMHILLAKLDVKISLIRIFLANSLSSLYSLVLPGDVFASMAKWANLSAVCGKKSLMLSTMVYNRIALMAPMLVIGTLALAMENPFADNFIVGGIIITWMLIMAVALSTFHPTFSLFRTQAFRFITQRLPFRIQELVEGVISSFTCFHNFRVRDHLTVYGFSFLGFLVNVSIMSCATRAVDIELSFFVLFWLTAVLFVFRQVPLTVANLGIRESILIVILGLYGVEPERAVTVGLILFSAHLFIALIGLIYQVALALGIARWTNPVDVGAT